MSYRIALIQWESERGIAESVHDELVNLGHDLVYFPFDGSVPPDSDVLFLYGPFGKALPALSQVDALPQRPIVVFWNTEGLPDPKLPWAAANLVGKARSWIGRLDRSRSGLVRQLATKPPLSLLDARMIRFRYMGDFFYAYQRGWIDVFFDISAVYAQFFRAHGLPAGVAPFGSFAKWHDDLNLTRDIDVLWMGKQGSSRRGQILTDLRRQLGAHGVEIYMADNVENPFIFGEERTRILNRTKITLNILRTWYDENSLRFCMAAPNRSLFVSEPLLPHVPQYQANVHYVSTPIEQLAQTILYYLKHDDKRAQIVQNAYTLSTTQVTAANSMRAIMAEVDKKRAKRIKSR